MKKLLAIITVLVYFLVNTGFVISSHYCMDEFESTEIGVSGDEKCGTCGMHKDGGCCREEVFMVKLNTNHTPSEILQPVLASSPVSIVLSDYRIPFFHQELTSPLHLAHGPPDRCGQTILIKNCVFRI